MCRYAHRLERFGRAEGRYCFLIAAAECELSDTSRSLVQDHAHASVSGKLNPEHMFLTPPVTEKACQL